MDRANTLTGKWVDLASVDNYSIKYVYKWENDMSQRYLWTNLKDVMYGLEYEHDFINRLHNYYHSFQLIYPKNQLEPAGFIYSYNYSVIDGYLWVSLYIVPEKHHVSLGTEAFVLFMKYLFGYFPIRKVYFDVFEYNNESIRIIRHAEFNEEAKYIDHKFFNGTYHTLYTFSITKDVFFQKLPSILKGNTFTT